jgi:NADH:ubiquinone oxidoreductase subunit K
MSFFEIAVLVTALLMIFAGCFCIAQTHHLLRILIGIEIAMKAVTLLLVFAGFVNGNDALAEVYAVTVICLEVVMMCTAAGIAINLYRTYGSMDIRNLKKLKG